VFWFVYNCLFAVIFVLMMPRFLWRMWRRGGYKKDFLERIGHWDAGKRARIRERPRIWVHAVSVGEVQVALCVMKEYRALDPDAAFILSTTTSTGHAVAAARIDPRDVLVYFPADFPAITKKTLDFFRPVGVILVECELWPNLMRLADSRGIPVALINGRISSRSAAGYRLVRVFFNEAIQHMKLMCVQTEQDRDRLVGLGADAARVRAMGAAKYDVARPDPVAEEKAAAALGAAGMDKHCLVLVGGSTWPGEEAILLDVFKRLRAKYSNARLVIVPRHAERGESVARKIAGSGLAFVRRSALGKGETAGPNADVLLVDTTGELMGYYARADVVFVGKSLTQHGGQNIIEPAMLGKPVVTGPNMENFAEVVNDFLAADALFRVGDPSALEKAVDSLFADGQLRVSSGLRAREVVEKKRGAVRSTAELIQREMFSEASRA
jgi:3-deoxy-D-manno-octulosonic-acid transferase